MGKMGELVFSTFMESEVMIAHPLVEMMESIKGELGL